MKTLTDFTTQRDNRRQAKFLYWMGWRVVDIAAFLEENATSHRFVKLILEKEKLKEFDLLNWPLGLQVRIQRCQNVGTECDAMK